MYVDSILEGEFAENEMRKDFTKSERVAIAAALEEEMGNRRGQRTDLPQDELSKMVSEVPKEKETRNIVAKKAGLGSGITFQQAKAVVDHGIDEVLNLETRFPKYRDAMTLPEPVPEVLEILTVRKSTCVSGNTSREACG